MLMRRSQLLNDNSKLMINDKIWLIYKYGLKNSLVEFGKCGFNVSGYKNSYSLGVITYNKDNIYTQSHSSTSVGYGEMGVGIKGYQAYPTDYAYRFVLCDSDYPPKYYGNDFFHTYNAGETDGSSGSSSGGFLHISTGYVTTTLTYKRKTLTLAYFDCALSTVRSSYWYWCPTCAKNTTYNYVYAFGFFKSLSDLNYLKRIL